MTGQHAETPAALNHSEQGVQLSTDKPAHGAPVSALSRIKHCHFCVASQTAGSIVLSAPRSLDGKHCMDKLARILTQGFDWSPHLACGLPEWHHHCPRPAQSSSAPPAASRPWPGAAGGPWCCAASCCRSTPACLAPQSAGTPGERPVHTDVMTSLGWLALNGEDVKQYSQDNWREERAAA